MPPAGLAYALVRAVEVVEHVMQSGRSLTEALTLVPVHDEARGRVQDIAYTSMRQWGRARWLQNTLTGGRQLEPVELDYLLTAGLCLAIDADRQRYDPHVLVDQTVTAAGSQYRTRPGKNLLNACLRRFYRERDTLLAQLAAKPAVDSGFPAWWVDRLQAQLPAQWREVTDHANTQPPLVLRVNRRKTSVGAFVTACQQAGLVARSIGDDAVWLPEPVPVYRIPGFAQGHASVQDLAAQRAATLLAPQDGMRVLDACCAPGGKTGHLLELADIELLALDSDEDRLVRVKENLQRLGLLGSKVSLLAADATKPDLWWDGREFDAILADVPCSASGVVRRHPDIRWLRRPEDVANMSQLQLKILDGLWSLLRPGGTLLIVTCSIFEEEGDALLQRFLSRHPDVETLSAPGLVLPLCQEDGPGHDGFFYARLRKVAPK
jgi:16S rRNA (cytosine967-C5)-methyltransferase